MTVSGELQYEEPTHSDIFLQCIKFAVQSCLSCTFRNALLQRLQLRILTDLIRNGHILPLWIEPQRSSHALARRAFEAGVDRRTGSGGSVGIFLRDDGR